MREEDRGKKPDHDTPDVIKEDGSPVTRKELSNFIKHGNYSGPPQDKERK